jgi:Flp pilus assembly protein TadD
VHYLHLIEIEPEMAGAYHNLAVCRFLADDFEGGIEQCEKARAIEPDNVMVLHKLALAYLHTGRWRRARDMAQQGLALVPDHPGLIAIPRSYLGFCIRLVSRRIGRHFRRN